MTDSQTVPPPDQLTNIFGHIDLYLLDQLFKGRIVTGMSILDAGCGDGRNLIYFLQNDFQVYAVDASMQALDLLRIIAPDLPADHVRQEPVEAMTFDSAFFDVVISSAVLHFARDTAHFEAMLHELWRVLKPGGLFFARLASSIGLEAAPIPRSDGRFLLPDGTERFLVDEAALLDYTRQLGGELLEPIKTVNVQNLRCMTTWVMRKKAHQNKSE